MYLGEIHRTPENTDEIFPVTQNIHIQKALLSLVLELNPHKLEKNILNLSSGELPSPENLPQGCKFHTRCPFVGYMVKEQSAKRKLLFPSLIIVNVFI